jgi:hypothetical protein
MADERRGGTRERLDAAWARATRTLVGSSGGHITAKELAETTWISVDEAEEILTRLAAFVGRVDVDGNAELHYRVAERQEQALPAPASEGEDDRRRLE